MSEDLKKLCFVIMPIGKREDGSYERWKNVYENIIKPAVQKADPDISCFRADEETKAGGIMDDIISHLHTDFLCIADLSDRNSNVYYELGLRDSWHNRTILITQKHEDAVFDKFGDRALLYHETDLNFIRKFERDIAGAINDIFRNPDSIRNPVQRYLESKGEAQRLKTSAEVLQKPSGVSPQDVTRFNKRISNLITVKNISPTRSLSDNEFFKVFESSTPGSGRSPLASLLPKEMYFFWKNTQFDPKDSSVYARFARAIKALAELNADSLFHTKQSKFIFPFCGKMENREKFLSNIRTHFYHNRMIDLQTPSLPALGTGSLPPLQNGWLGYVTFEIWDIEDVERLEMQYSLALQ